MLRNFAAENKKITTQNTLKMKTNKTNKTAKQASKSINAAAAAARKEVRVAGKALRDERKSLAGTIRLLCTAETEDAKIFRETLGLKKSANSTDRRAAAEKIRKMYEYCILTYYMEQRIYPHYTYTTCIGVEQIPAYKSGREKTDYLTVCTDAVALIRARQAAVREAKQLAKNGVVNVENLSAAARRNLTLHFGNIAARRRVVNIRRYNNCGEHVTLLLPATLPPRED